MTPPHAPGIPGTRLPEPWEREMTDLKRRVTQLEQDAGTTRRTLESYNGEEEDSQVKIPSDAPARAKVVLGFASGLTPNGRLIIGLALIAALVLLILRGVKLWP